MDRSDERDVSLAGDGRRRPAGGQAGCKDPRCSPRACRNTALRTARSRISGSTNSSSTKGPKTPVEGKFTFIAYSFTGERANEPSVLAVVRNYENAFRKAGGTILQSDPQTGG